MSNQVDELRRLTEELKAESDGMKVLLPICVGIILACVAFLGIVAYKWLIVLL